MTDVPHHWDVNEAIPIEIFVQDPATTGDGLTGQLSFLTLIIQRASDDFYWNGASWQSGVVSLDSTDGLAEVDSTNQPGRYLFILPAAANDQVDRYTARGNINNAGLPLTGDNYEVHVSRPPAIIVEAEPAQ